MTEPTRYLHTAVTVHDPGIPPRRRPRRPDEPKNYTALLPGTPDTMPLYGRTAGDLIGDHAWHNTPPPPPLEPVCGICGTDIDDILPPFTTETNKTTGDTYRVCQACAGRHSPARAQMLETARQAVIEGRSRRLINQALNDDEGDTT